MAEALHDTAAANVRALLDTLTPLITTLAASTPRHGVLSDPGSQFDS